MNKVVGLLVLIALLAAPLAALAADATVYADFMSRYISKGQVGGEDPVFQPGLDVSSDWGLTFSLWGSMDLADDDKSWYPDSKGKWGEWDIGASWTTPFEDWPVAATIGATYFVYPQDEESDGNYEIYAKVAATSILLNPTLGIYYDCRDSEDWYGLFSLGHSFDLSDTILSGLSLDLGGTVGYGARYYAQAAFSDDCSAGFTHVEVSAALNYAVTDNISVGLKGIFSSIIDSDMRDGVDADERDIDPDNFYGGFNVSYNF